MYKYFQSGLSADPIIRFNLFHRIFHDSLIFGIRTWTPSSVLGLRMCRGNTDNLIRINGSIFDASVATAADAAAITGLEWKQEGQLARSV